MKVNLEAIEQQVESNEYNRPTGDVWLDSRINEDIPIIGHTQPYYRLFHWIARTHKPRLSVELGSWRATAACSIASGNPDGRVITIDIHREDKVAQQKCREAVLAYHNLEYINGWTWDDWVVKRVRDVGVPIDMLFIDAWHWREYVEREWSLYVPMMAREGLIICDDIFNDPSVTVGMREFWDELKYDKFENSGIHPGIPMGFVAYVRS